MKEFVSKNKKDINFFLLLLVITSLSFGLGYLSAQEIAKPAIVIEKISNPQLDS